MNTHQSDLDVLLPVHSFRDTLQRFDQPRRRETVYTRTQRHNTSARNQSDSDDEDPNQNVVQIKNGFSLIVLMVKRHGVISMAIS